VTVTIGPVSQRRLCAMIASAMAITKPIATGTTVRKTCSPSGRM
jgi:hypothetical protein